MYSNYVITLCAIGLGLMLFFQPQLSEEISYSLNEQLKTDLEMYKQTEDPQREQTDFQAHEKVETMFKEDLPKITSEKTIERTGFFQGVNNHKARGQAEIVIRDNLPYLVLDDIQISYSGSTNAELDVYITRGGDVKTGIRLGVLDTVSPYSIHELFDPTAGSERSMEFLDYEKHYNVVVIYDESSRTPVAKAILYQPYSANIWLSYLSYPLTQVQDVNMMSGEIRERTGFFQGVNNHKARGQAEIVIRDNLPYLVLDDIQISYSGSTNAELDVYITRGGDVKTGIRLGGLELDPLQREYSLGGINVENLDTVLIADSLTERPFAIANLRQNYNLLGLLSDYLIQDIIANPNTSTKTMQQKIGYFKDVNSPNSKGIVKLFTTEESLMLSISDFEISYEKEWYVSTKSNEFLLTKPNPHVYLTTEDQKRTIHLGKLESNIPELQYKEIFNEDNVPVEYDLLFIFDETTKRTLVTASLKYPWLLETSPYLFWDWLLLYFPNAPLLIALILIFPLTFDYFRIIGKIIVLSFVAVKNRKKVIGASLVKPKITIMIPAHNEEAGIRGSINSAIAVDYPNKEIIVIDDGSTDQTYRIAREFYDKGLIKLVHREEASGSKATALNYGSNYATGDLLLCMDGDTRLDKHSLSRLSSFFADEEVLAVSGNVKIIAGDPDENNRPVHNTLTKLQSYEYTIAMELGRRFMSILNMVLIISGAFGVFRRRDFKSIGMYDKDNITEDFDLTLKIKKEGGKIEFVEDSLAWTYCPNNFGAWVKQRTRWAYGQMQTLRKHRDVLRNRRFKSKYLIAIADMWLLDVMLNFLFVFYVIGIIIALGFNIINVGFFINVIVLVTMAYILMETVVFLLASSISTKTSKKLVYLAPVMAIFYRPLLRMIVFNAYLRSLLRKKITW